MSIDEDEGAPTPATRREITHIAYLTDELAGWWGLAVWYVEDTRLTAGRPVFGEHLDGGADPRAKATHRLRRAGYHLVGTWQPGPPEGSIGFAAWAIRLPGKPYLPGPGPRHP